MLDTPLLLIFPAAMAFAAAMDLVSMTIPNRISVALAGAFVVVAAWAGLPATDVLSHLGAGTLMLIVGIGMFALGWMGGGDAKLLAAGALWLGIEQLLPFLVLTGVFGALLTFFMVLYRAYPVAALPIPDWAARLHRKETGMPYGLAICAGGLGVFPQAPLFRVLLGL